ncbi:MAG TPA: SPOR domain-containing protein, partial [Spirochaetia bacterium]|nr:SPOR domain-containing protein [Spirochaetia bacterium]
PADKRPPVVTEKTTEEPKIKPEEKKPDEEKPIVRVVEEPPAGKEAGGTVKEEVKETARKEEGQALPFTPTLLKGSYYLQLGAFSEEAKARRLAAQFTSTYPMTIQVAESGAKKTYKVLIGPLKPDESGALLFTLKASGYKDAFVVKN